MELRCHEKGSCMGSFLSIPRDIKEPVGKEGPILATVGYMEVSELLQQGTG